MSTKHTVRFVFFCIFVFGVALVVGGSDAVVDVVAVGASLSMPFLLSCCCCCCSVAGALDVAVAGAAINMLSWVCLHTIFFCLLL